MKKLIAHWATRGGRCWYKLYRIDDGCFEYDGDSCGGRLYCTEAAAMAHMEKLVHTSKEYDDINYRRMPLPQQGGDA